MQTMIDTRVPICKVPGCSGALDKGFMNNPGGYQGTYYFCTNCGMRYLIAGLGQSENELLCDYSKGGNTDEKRNKKKH